MIGLQRDTVIKPHVDGIIASSEANGLYVYKDIQQLGAAAFEGNGGAEYISRSGGGEKLQILQTVLVFAGIHDLSRVNADRFLHACAICCDRAGEYMTCHA